MVLRPRNVVLFFVVCSLAHSAAGYVASPVDTAREELIQFSEQVRDVPGIDPAASANAKASIAAAPDDAVMSLHKVLNRVDGWQQMPKVVADLSRALNEQQNAQLQRIIDDAVAGPAAALDPASQAVSRRQTLHSIVTFFRGLSPLAGSESDQRWATVQYLVETANPEVLPAIAKALANGAELLRAELERPSQTENLNFSRRLTPRTDVDCSSYCCTQVCDPTGILGCGDVCIPGCTAACDAIVSAVNSAVAATKAGLEATKKALEDSFNFLTSEFNRLTNEVAALASQVAGYANQIAGFVTAAFTATTNLINQIGALVTSIGTTFANLYNGISSAMTGFFNELIALVPTTPEAAFNLLTGIQLTSTAWVDTLISRFPILEPPCPAFGTDVGPLGVVGTLAATQKAEGLAKLTKILYDAAPADAAGLPIKLKVAAVYHPAEYWSLCARSRYAIAQWDAENAHRNLESTNLNVQLSTRATQTSASALGVSVSGVDDDVARTETKLNLLAPKTDELLRRLDQPLSTRAMQTSVDTLRGSVRTLDRDVAKIETKLDILQTNVRQKARNQSDRQAALASFEALMTRLAIEDNLLESNSNVISLFQLPEAFGGQLSLVRSVVEKTMTAMLASGQSIRNAQAELSRGDALMPVGDFAGAFKQFRKAYGEAVKP